MILGWKNIDAFKRHMEEMESFRRVHSHLTPAEQQKLVRVAELPFDTSPANTTWEFTGTTDDNGKTVVVPIWDISIAKGTQN